MKKTLLFLVFSLLFFASIQLHAQRFREVVLWEIKTTNGGLIVGASLNEAAADLAINDFTARNKGHNYQAYLAKKKFTTFKVIKTEALLSDLRSKTPRGYVVISAEELQVLEKFKGKSFAQIAAAYASIGRNSYQRSLQEIQLISKYQIGKRITPDTTRIVSK